MNKLKCYLYNLFESFLKITCAKTHIFVILFFDTLTTKIFSVMLKVLISIPFRRIEDLLDRLFQFMLKPLYLRVLFFHHMDAAGSLLF